MIDRRSVVGEDLVATVTIQPGRGSARNCVRKRVVGDLKAVVIYVGNGEGMSWTGIYRLNGIAGFTQMDAARAHVSDFQDPAFAEFALQGQVPLLCVGHHETPGNFENEKILRGIYSRSTGAGVRAILAACIIRREAGEPGEAGDPCRRKRSCGR